MSSSASFSTFCEAPSPAFLTHQSKVSVLQSPTCCLSRLYRQNYGICINTQRCCLKTNVSRLCLQRFFSITRCAMDTSFDGQLPVFPRINVRDPYKRLGISKEASEEEIRAARVFLINQYSGHKPSVDAIESAYDKILLESFRARRRPKFDFQGKWKKMRQSRVIKFISSRFEAPSTNVILATAALFLVLGTWSILYPFPSEDGPVLQVAISLMACIYFIYARLNNRLRAFLYGFGAFFVSWVLGSFLMATVLPPIITGPRSIEVSTSVISYIFLWIASAYLK